MLKIKELFGRALKAAKENPWLVGALFLFLVTGMIRSCGCY